MNREDSKKKTLDWARVPTTSTQTHTRQWFDLQSPRGAIAAVLLMRVLLGIWGLGVSAIFPDSELEKRIAIWPPTQEFGLWLHRVLVSPWMRYDYEYYAWIIERGYRTDDGTASFHPLYPLLGKFFFLFTHNAQASLLIVSTIAAVVGTLLIARYTARFQRPEWANAAGWFYLVGPLGWVLLAPYTEGTFLAFSIAALWAMRVQRFWLAGILAALATLTRQQGIALMLPLIWQLWQAHRASTLSISLSDNSPESIENKAAFLYRRHDWLCLALVPAAYAMVSLYRIFVVGETPSITRGWVGYLSQWLVSPSTEIVVPGSGLALPWRPFIETLHLLPRTPNPYHLWIDLLLGWALVLVIVLGWKHLHASEKIYCAMIVLAAICFYSAPYMSLPRHVVLAFPISLIGAVWAHRIGKVRFLIQLSAIINLLLFSAFARHGWVP